MEIAKAMPDKDNSAGKALEVSKFTNTLRQSEAQKLLTNKVTLWLSYKQMRLRLRTQGLWQCLIHGGVAKLTHQS